jgi:glycosyltransferase involved in cell wall biosynthesis
MKTKVAVIGTVGLPAKYGGFETLASHLISHLGQKIDFTVYCSSKAYPKEERKSKYKTARLKFVPLKANGVQSILYDAISIVHALLYADVLLVLGVAGAWVFPLVRWFTRKKIIVSIDGIEWKRDKWNLLAKSYLFWAESVAVKYSHIDISDNESIQDYTAMRYNSLSRIIEYGADHTINSPISFNDTQKFPFLTDAYAFKVCRIEPENNVNMVLKAFAQLPKYNIVIVGNWNNSTYGIQLRLKYESFKNIHLLDPIYDQKTLDKIRGNALLYIHGHSAGGTNPSLVEAMYLGLPIISFGVSYNRTTTENKSLYFKSSDDLIHLIKSSNVSQLKKQGKLMKAIAKRRYTWKIIAHKYQYLFYEAMVAKSKSVVQKPIDYQLNDQLTDMELGHLNNQQLFFEKR